MAYTYTTLKTAIQDFVEDSGTTFNANIDNFIENAEQRIFSMVDLPLDRRNSTGNLTTSNKYLSTPEDFLSTYSLSVISDNTHYFLLNKDVNFIREAFPNPTTTGQPTHYALFDQNSYILGPTPDQDYTSELHYFYYPPSIVTSSTSWLGDNFDSVLLYGALIEAHIFMKGEADSYQSYVQRYNESMALLKQLSEGKNRQDMYRTKQVRLKIQ